MNLGAEILQRLVPRRSPDFLILGAQKSGTTTLFNQLIRHPGCAGARRKEVRYFDRDDNYNKGKDWYEGSFYRPLVMSGLFFEATPEYLYRSYVPKRIHSHYPSIKLIVVLRDPVSRAYSAWNMYRDFLVNRKNIPESIKSGYLYDRENQLFKQFYKPDSFPSFEETVRDELANMTAQEPFEEPSILRRGL